MKHIANYPFFNPPELGVVHYVDYHTATLAANESLTIDTVISEFFSISLPFFDTLMKIRTVLVKPFGLKTPDASSSSPMRKAEYTKGDFVYFFEVLQRDHQYMLLGQDDVHIRIRIHVMLESIEQQSVLYSISTVVNCKNAFGKFYMAIIAPIHAIMMRYLMKNIKKRIVL